MVDKIVIEDGIPIPERDGPYSPGRKVKYPFDKLGVGQSFFVPCRDGQNPNRLSSILSGAVNGWRLRQRLSWQWAYRMEQREEGGRIGVRLWRIPDKAAP